MKIPNLPVRVLIALICNPFAWAGPLEDGQRLLQSRKYAEAAAKLAEAADDPQAQYLHALSLHLAGKSADALPILDRVAAESPWGQKALFLKATVFSALKRHAEAEAIYAAASAKAFAPARRDGLVKDLLALAEEAAHPTATGEVEPPKPDWTKATALHEKVLDLPITLELRADVLYRKARLLYEAKQYNAAMGTANAWLLKFDPTWTLPYKKDRTPPHREVTAVGTHRLEARKMLAECLLELGRWGDARLAAEEWRDQLAKEPNAISAQADAAWLRVRTFAQASRTQAQQQTRSAQQADPPEITQDFDPTQIPTNFDPAQIPTDFDPFQNYENFSNGVLPGRSTQRLFRPAGNRGELGLSGARGSRYEQFANLVEFPALATQPVYTEALYLKELQAFLSAFKAHSAAPQAAEAIAATLQRHGKPDEAFTAYERFISRQEFIFDAQAAENQKPNPATGQTPAEALLKRQQAAEFTLGKIRFDQAKYADAIRLWQKYIAAHPNAAEWQQAQTGIVNAEFEQAIAAVASGEEKQARELLETFLTKYPLDGRARQILFIFGQMPYSAGQIQKAKKAAPEVTKPLFEQAITEWARLISKYPNTEESSLALYNSALILTSELNRMEEGVAAFKRLDWGQWATTAKERVTLLSNRSLAAAAERVFRTSETPRIKVNVHNIEKVKVSRYPLDVEAFFRSRHRMDAIDLLDIDLIAPEKTWEVPIANYVRYRAIEQEIPVEFPEGQAGACVVRVETEDWQATTLLVRSDVDVLVECARREALIYVQHGPDKKPLAGAQVLVSDGTKIVATGLSDAEGVFRTKPVGLETLQKLSVYVSSPQGMAGTFLDTMGLGLSVQPEKVTRVIFDRAHYLAGHMVKWHALRRGVKDGKYPVLEPGEGWKWRAQLPDGRLLYEGPITWDALGMAQGSFLLPPSAMAGEYKVRLFNETAALQGLFSVGQSNTVGENHLQIMAWLPKQYLLLGEKLQAAFQVTWSSGLPAADQPVWLELGDQVVERKTDAQGRVSWESTAENVGPGRLICRTEQTQIQAQFYVADREFKLQVKEAPRLMLAGEAANLKVQAQRYDQKPQAAEVKLQIVRPAAPRQSRVLEAVPWLKFTVPPIPESVVHEQIVQIPAAGELVVPVTLAEPGNFLAKLTSKDATGKEVVTQISLDVRGGDSEAKIRLLGETKLAAGQTAQIRLQSSVAHPRALVTVHAQEFFSHHFMPLQVGSNSISLPVLDAYAPNFRVTVAAMDGKEVFLTSRPFEVATGLQVKLQAATDGITVETKDTNGQAKAATLIATWMQGQGLSQPQANVGTVVVPLRSTGLSIETSATFYHSGITKMREGKGSENQLVLTSNNIARFNYVADLESSLNKANLTLSDNNRQVFLGNAFLAQGAAQKIGVMVLNPGLALMNRTALGQEVEIQTPGDCDIEMPQPQIANAPQVARWRYHLDSVTTLHSVTQEDGSAKIAATLTPTHAHGFTVLAITADSLFGAASLLKASEAKIEIVANLPPNLTPGQKYQIPLVIENTAPEALPGPLEVNINVAGQQIIRRVEGDLAPLSRTVVLTPELSAPAGAPASVSVFATAQMREIRAETAKNLTIPVRSLQGVQAHVLGGLFGAGEHTVNLPAGESFQVVAASDLASLPLQLLAENGHIQDGSEAQTAASELLHLLAALKAAPQARQAALKERLAQLTAELAVTEREGGWSWENIAISPGLLTTAFTWRVLLEAKSRGAVVSELLLGRTAKFVTGRYQGIGATDFERKAVVLQAMASAGQAEFSLLNPLYRSRETLTPVALSRLCVAFIHAGRMEEAREVMQLLLKSATPARSPLGEPILSWTGSKDVAGLNAPEETTAAALWCLTKLDATAPELRQIALALLNSPATAPGGASRARGQAFHALAEYAAHLPKTAENDTVQILASGNALEQNPSKIWSLPADGKVTFRVSGNAPAPVVFLVTKEIPAEDPKTWEFPKIGTRSYLHRGFAVAEHPLSAESTSPVNTAASGQIIRVSLKLQNHPDAEYAPHGNFLDVLEEIPAGCQLLMGSLEHNAHAFEQRGNQLRFRYGPGTLEHISYKMVAVTPGTWTSRAAILQDPYDARRCRRGVPNTLTILPPGQASPDAYVLNRAEHMELAQHYFEANQGAECLKHLDALATGRLSQTEEQNVARMRLWILCAQPDGDARTLIGAFELLTERHPQLMIPFEKLLQVAAAYRRLNELERAAAVQRAALDGAFLQDSTIGVALEDAGDYLGGVQLQEHLWQSYPDSRDVQDALAGLAQSLSAKANAVEKIQVRRGQDKPTKNSLLSHSRGLLQRYTTLYAPEESADDAAFSLVNTYFALKDYVSMEQAASAAAATYAKSDFQASFSYMAALGWFWQGQFDKALVTAAPVANGTSKDRDYARYVTAQIYHAQRKTPEAIQWYEKVKNVYQDAAEVIKSFEQKNVQLPEITTFLPGEPVRLKVDYRNVADGSLQVYKVDLAKLFTTQRSLEEITKVNLAGIVPQSSLTFPLGTAKDYVAKEKTVDLPIKEEGAYLAIVRGDDLFSSGLILISPLKLEIREPGASSVRVNVTNASSGLPISDAEIIAMGGNQEQRSSTTDPRGMAELVGLSGIPSVLVKHGENHYALVRGKHPILTQSTSNSVRYRIVLPSKEAYFDNISLDNGRLQQKQIENWDGKRRSNPKGVEAKDVLSK